MTETTNEQTPAAPLVLEHELWGADDVWYCKGGSGLTIRREELPGILAHVQEHGEFTTYGVTLDESDVRALIADFPCTHPGCERGAARFTDDGDGLCAGHAETDLL